MATASDIEKRFWEKVDLVCPGDCWEWTGAKYSNGYGHIHVRNPNRHLLAHRFSYELFNGEIPAGLCVLHRCDNRGCVSPHHLFLGTHSDNIQDCLSKGRFNAYDRHGEANPNCKLREKDVIEIRSSNESNQTLAIQFNLDPQTIHRIRNRKLWPHI